jgi:hypothetical protein
MNVLLLRAPVVDRPVLRPLAVGLTSASGFAVPNAVEHRVAGTVPPPVRRATAVLGHLARRPQWLAATCNSFLAMLCHAAALRLGPRTLVQPLMLAGGVVGVAAAAVLTVWGRGLRASQSRAALLGVAAGVLFGLTAGLLTLTSSPLADGTLPYGRTLVVAGLVVVGLMGTAPNQRAYQIAPIAFSMPLVNVLDIAVALGFGALGFGEVPGHSTGALLVQLVTLTCVGWGLREIPRFEVEEAPCLSPATVLS